MFGREPREVASLHSASALHTPAPTQTKAKQWASGHPHLLFSITPSPGGTCGAGKGPEAVSSCLSPIFALMAKSYAEGNREVHWRDGNELTMGSDLPG